MAALRAAVLSLSAKNRRGGQILPPPVRVLMRSTSFRSGKKTGFDSSFNSKRVNIYANRSLRSEITLHRFATVQQRHEIGTRQCFLHFHRAIEQRGRLLNGRLFVSLALPCGLLLRWAVTRGRHCGRFTSGRRLTGRHANQTHLQRSQRSQSNSARTDLCPVASR